MVGNMSDAPHGARSDSQVDAEAFALAATELTVQGCPPLRQHQVVTFGDVKVKPDGLGVDSQGRVWAAEVFTRPGRMRGGQLHKVSTDAERLRVVSKVHKGARLLIVLTSQQAADSVRRWQAALWRDDGIEVVVVDLPAESEAAVKAAVAVQRRSNMAKD